MMMQTIEMDRNAARKAFLEYRNAVRAEHRKQDEEIMRGYRALSKGNQLINLPATIKAGGTTTITVSWAGGTRRISVPLLAVARGGSEYAWTAGIDEEGRCEIRGKQQIPNSNQRDRITVRGFEPGRTDWTWRPRIRAMMPLIPPLLRPADKVSNYHVLWEAEWSVVTPPVPKDPALLKHIGGAMYAVVAVWDLTELERGVLANG